MKTYTDEEIKRMQQYEQKTGERIIYSFEEKCSIYMTKDREKLRKAVFGIKNAINARSLDEYDCFDGPDDGWKLKVLEENLEAIEKILREK